MSVIKEIDVDGRKVRFNASAAVPRIYRARFGRDLFMDLSTLIDEVNRNSKESSGLTIGSLETFEDIAYTMAKSADPAGVPETPEEWLDSFDIFSIYSILPQIMEMWRINSETTSESKKKVAAPPTDQ